MSELRLYARRDSLQDGAGCAWVLLDASGKTQRSGYSLDEVPATRHCRLVLAADLTLALKADLPNLPARKLAAMLPAVAETATLDDAEQLHVVTLGNKAGAPARLAVVRKAWLERLLNQLRGRGLHPGQAVPEYLLLPWSEGEWSVLIHEDGAVARFGEHDGVAIDNGDPPAGIHLALAQGPAPKCIRVYQGSALKAPDVEAWRLALDLPVEFAGKWDWREAAWNDQANLLTGAFTAARGRRDWRALLRPLAIGTALLVLLQVLGMTVHWLSQTREQAGIRAEMRALAERVLPAQAAVVDPAWQVGERLRALRAASGDSSEGSRSLLARLGRAWPHGAAPIPGTVNYAGKGLELTLASADDHWLEELKSAGTARGLAITVEKDASGQALVRIRTAPAGSGGKP